VSWGRSKHLGAEALNLYTVYPLGRDGLPWPDPDVKASASLDHRATGRQNMSGDEIVECLLGVEVQGGQLRSTANPQLIPGSVAQRLSCAGVAFHSLHHLTRGSLDRGFKGMGVKPKRR